MLLSARRAACLLPLAALSSCDEPLATEECRALLDQYVALLASSDRPGTTETDLLKLKAEAREKAARDPAFRECPQRVSRRQFECAMRADHVDRLEQCLL